MWHIEEQRKAELRAAADARYRRICAMNAAEIAIAESEHRAHWAENQRLIREAAERRARIATFDAQRAARKPTPARGVWRRTVFSGRPCEVRDVPGGFERRFLDVYSEGWQ